jgi:hypothetical protein
VDRHRHQARVVIELRQQAVQRLLVVAGLLVSLAGCARRAEQHILRGYFDTCALADEAALETIALVALDPRRHGVVGHFTITGRSAADPREAGALPAARLSLPPSSGGDPSTADLDAQEIYVIVDLHQGGVVRRASLRVTLARARSRGNVGRWIVVRLVLDGQTVT